VIRQILCFASQEENEEEVDYVKSKMRSGLSQVLQHMMKSGIGTYLARYRRSFAEVLHISAWVFAGSVGAKETFGEMNKARIYKELVNITQRRREQCCGLRFV